MILWFLLAVGCARVAEETAVSPPTSPLSPTPTLAHANAASQKCANPVPADREFPLPPWPRTNFCRHSVPYETFSYGGASRDSIPALDNPAFISIAETEQWITDQEPVLVLQLNEDVRAYPIPILIWHEIVNDVVDGRPVVITYCPLCDSGLAFERTVAGQTLDFGTTGILRNADLVMYDRQTESWWQQFSGEAVVGEMTGAKLPLLPVNLVSWADFKAQFPNGRVLSIFTGFDRTYGETPYINYDSLTNLGVKFYDGEPDDRLPPKMRVMAIVIQGEAVAYPYALLAEKEAVNDTLAGQPLVVFWKSGTNSPLYEQFIAEAKDVGSAQMFSREAAGQTLTFGPAGDGESFVDVETGSRWNLWGTAVAGTLTGTQLNPLPGHEFFWFAWAAFQPQTKIFEDERGLGDSVDQDFRHE